MGARVEAGALFGFEENNVRVRLSKRTRRGDWVGVQRPRLGRSTWALFLAARGETRSQSFGSWRRTNDVVPVAQAAH